MNLHDETFKRLKAHGYGKDDIDWIGCREFYVDQDQFWKVSDTEYHEGFGCQEVAADLIIVMKDGSYFDRYEYDGAECWKYHPPLRKPIIMLENLEVLTEDQWLKTHDMTPSENTLKRFNGYIKAWG